MKIAVMATGGVGAVFGAKLVEAGEDVTFLARGAHLSALTEKGLTIACDGGERHIEKINVTEDPSKVGVADVVIFAVKLWDTKTAAEACKPMLGPESIVIPFQNGVTSSEMISRVIGANHVGRGLSRVSASIEEPGTIRQIGSFASLAFAEMDGTRSPRIEKFFDTCRRAKIDAEIPSNILQALWRKYILLVTLSGMTTAARQPMRSIIREEEGLNTAIACMTEVAAVGRAQDIDIPLSTVGKLEKVLQTMPLTLKASQAIDLEKGNRLEAPWLTGNICQMGRSKQVATPVNDALYAVIKPYIMGRPPNQ